MGQLRNAFRAYALDHASPAAIVERLSRHVDDERMATTVCVAVDPFTRELTYSSAGHLPPLLVGAAGETRRLDGTAGPPLGWSSRGAQIDAHETLAPGTLLALYTDGLVERRGHGLDEGIDGLAAELVGIVRGAPGRTAGDVVERLGRADADDDVALLLVGIGEVPAAIGLEIPAQPALLRELRRRIDRWLTLRGVDEQRRQNVVLALSEACNNAIEHGYRNGHGTVSLRLEHDRERLRIVIDDEGTWVDPTVDDTRGRGLLIMRALMNDADVEHGANGTRVTLEQRLG
jgi:anti-sigma regulatory factor (Ser/Thr protein kinase)